MIRAVKNISAMLLLTFSLNIQAQNHKIIYHPCFLMDSVDKHLDFIVKNATRVFVDTFDCRQTLLDSIAIRYVETGDTKYLYSLSSIHINAGVKVEDLYTDIVKRFAEHDFSGFINRLYVAKGALLPLQNELIAAMNMIIDGRPLKQKYMGRLNVEIEITKDAKDKGKETYLEKLKSKIDGEKF